VFPLHPQKPPFPLDAAYVAAQSVTAGNDPVTGNYQWKRIPLHDGQNLPIGLLSTHELCNLLVRAGPTIGHPCHLPQNPAGKGVQPCRLQIVVQVRRAPDPGKILGDLSSHLIQKIGPSCLGQGTV
jgi:hypothetical protein